MLIGLFWTDRWLFFTQVSTWHIAGLMTTFERMDYAGLDIYKATYEVAFLIRKNVVKNGTQLKNKA